MFNKILFIIRSAYLKHKIGVIVWDFDGTIFQSEELGKAYEYKYFEYSKRFSRNQKLTLDGFRSKTKLSGSWKNAASSITGHRGISIVNWVDKKINKTDYVKPNREIVKLLNGLTKQKHIILSNAKKKEIIEGLIKIGFKANNKQIYPFVNILSRDDGVNKPNINSFKKITKITKMTINKHLMIGDSEREDLIPAKKFGFSAIYVNDGLKMLSTWIKQ